MTTRWDSYDYDDLVNILSDYSKDVQGFRMRMHGAPREAIINALDGLDKYMEVMNSTPEGRAQLAEDGWVV